MFQLRSGRPVGAGGSQMKMQESQLEVDVTCRQKRTKGLELQSGVGKYFPFYFGMMVCSEPPLYGFKIKLK